MSALNRFDNFSGRVNYAARVIADGRETTRSFDNCFENVDGRLVSAALIRRSRINPKIAANLPRYLDPSMAQACADRVEGQNLKAASRTMWLDYFAKNPSAARYFGAAE